MLSLCREVYISYYWQGNEDVEALELCVLDYIQGGYTITDEEVASLRNLRFLRGRGINFVRNFRNLLSKLRWLSWHDCPPNFAAIYFCPINLVVLDLSESNITEEWGGWSQIKVNYIELTFFCFFVFF